METKTDLKLIMFEGIPASGKSTFAKKYKLEGYVVLSSDEVRADLEEKINAGLIVMPNNSNLNSMTFESLKSEAIRLIKSGQSVVVDATNLGRKRRMNFMRTFGKYGCARILLLFITSPEVCFERNAKRIGYAKVPDEAMYNMLCSFECPNYWEGWDEIIPVIDKTPFKFDFERVKGLNQDNPHHTLTLDKHMEGVYNYAVEHGYSDRVKKIALYHDAGKFYTKRFLNRRGEKTETAHYYGHENYGAYLYLAESCCGKELTNDEFKEILYLVNLINCHMRPLNLWRDCESVKEKDKILFGEQFFTDLINLNKADRAAH